MQDTINSYKESMKKKDSEISDYKLKVRHYEDDNLKV